MVSFVKKTMANKQIDMRKAKRIYKLYGEGASKRRISKELGISRNTVAKYIEFFKCYRLTPYEVSEMTLEEILSKLDPEMQEVHIVGGHHPDWPFERYEGIIRGIHEAFPSIRIKAWTAAEIDYFCKRFRMTEEEVLTRMKDAGLVSMPGGGAEVFSDRVRKELFPGKNSANR